MSRDPLDELQATFRPEEVAVMETPPRLAWQHSWPDHPGPDFGYREGHDWARIVLSRQSVRPDPWQWHVSIDALPGALCAGGNAITRQEAADRATEAWHRLKAQRDNRS